MHAGYERGKEIQNQNEVVLKEFKVASWGVRWVKPFHTQCWRRRTKFSRRGYTRAGLAVLAPTCVAIFYLIPTLL